MTAPRIEVDLAAIRQNARLLVDRLAPHGISVTGVTKAVCGHPQIAQAMLDGGVSRLADARVSNVERMRRARIDAPVVLIRTPMHSQTGRIVRACGSSLNTDAGVIEALGRAALQAGLVHQVVLMVEMGDGREGVPASEMAGLARCVMAMPGVLLTGIGANFSCLSGHAPEACAMEDLSALTALVERACGLVLRTVSGGNSANLDGLLRAGRTTRVNDLRLGEAILLGRDPLTRLPIAGLSTDAFVLIGEVIETTADASQPHHGLSPAMVRMTMGDRGSSGDGGGGGGGQSLLALGDQDTDPGGLTMQDGLTGLGSTSDHLLLQSRGIVLTVGSEVRFQPDYSALMRAMSAPDVAQILGNGPAADPPGRESRPPAAGRETGRAAPLRPYSVNCP